MATDDLSNEYPELRPPLIGRGEEIDLVCRKMDEACRGRGSVVVTVGDAGVGKTRLMEEVERLSRERGMLFLRGAGDARRAGLAYGVFIEELGVYLDYVSAEEGRELRQTVAELAPHLWGSLFPAEEAPPTNGEDMTPELRQSLFLARLGRLLLDLAKRQPLVLCLEDLHWADSASLQLLNFLTNRNDSAQLLLLATCRPERREGEVDLQKLLRELQLKNHTRVGVLQPLKAEETRQLATSCFAPQAFDEGLMGWLHRKSGGVPLYVLQYLELLREKRVIFEQEGMWRNRAVGEKQEPDTLKGAIRQRLENLGQEELQILTYASVQGDAFEGRLVARTLGMPLTRVMRVLGELVRTTRLVRTAERKFQFAHTLLSEMFYEMLSEEKRRRAHMRLASILEEQKVEDPEVLAYHFYKAAAFDRALPYLIEGGQRNLTAFAYRETDRFVHQAETAIQGLKAEDVRAERLEIWLIAAEIADRTGETEKAASYCRQILTEADRKRDRRAIVRALMQLGRLAFRRGNWEEATEHYWDAQGMCAELGEEAMAARIYVRLGNIAFERSDLVEAASRYRDAREAAVKCANYGLQGMIHGNLAVVATVRGEFMEAVLGYTEALKAYRRINHSYGLGQTYHNLGMANAAQGEWAEALKCYEQGYLLAREMGTLELEANILVAQAAAEMEVGDLEAGDVACKQARAQMEQLGDRLGEAECDKVEGMIRRAQEEYREAEECLTKGRHIFAEFENLLGAAECDLELGRLLQAQGKMEEARLRLEASKKGFLEVGAEVDARRAETLLTALVA